MNIPEQPTVPEMPERSKYEDTTINVLINALETAKLKGASGEELILFRDFESQKLYMPTYPVLTLEESFNPIDGEKLCHRVIIECRMT